MKCWEWFGLFFFPQTDETMRKRGDEEERRGKIRKLTRRRGKQKMMAVLGNKFVRSAYRLVGGFQFAATILSVTFTGIKVSIHFTYKPGQIYVVNQRHGKRYVLQAEPTLTAAICCF